MKKFALVLCVLMVSLMTYASENGVQIRFSVDVINPGGGIGQRPRSPIQPPVVYLENYTLSFNAFEEDCAIQLLDEDDVVVFSSVIPAGTTSFLLPTTLEGEYQIQLIYGNFIFVGYIDL